ncbi:hypothetical protein BJ165DRAFT_746167 [Panaeolus papilionaceus]|nr:hypothetical protein BJ165DRAFT_746167 [Panaeolus papilionaceus]
MRSQRLPNDVLQEIIRALAQEKQHLRKFLWLSSFCREEAKKHIFSLVNLGFGVQRSKAEFVSLFSDEDGPTSYVRALIILLTHDDWADETIQTGFHNIVPKLKNLTSLHIISTSALEWTSLPPLSIRSAIRDSAQDLPLRDLTICLLRPFPVDDIAYLPHLRRLNILCCRLTINHTNGRLDRPATLRSHNIEALQIRRSTIGTFLEDVISPLLARDSMNNFLLPLSNIKSLDMDICSPNYFKHVISLMTQHNIQCLQDLTIHILLDEWPSITDPNDCSQWLDQIILPQHPTLRTLKIKQKR